MVLPFAPGSQVTPLTTPPAVVAATPSEVIVGLVCRATGTGEPTTKPERRLVNTLAEATEYLGDAVDDPNEGLPAVQRIYANASNVRVVISTYEETLSGADLTAAINAAIRALESAGTEVNAVPNVILAPGLGHAGGTTPTTAQGQYETQLASTANALQALVVVDTPPPAASAGDDLTIDEISGTTSSWIANNNNARFVGVDGWQGTRANPIPGSPNYAGALARMSTLRGQGWWTSPLAHEVLGVTQQLRIKSFSENIASQDDVSKLANVGIASFVRAPAGTGQEIWGYRLLLQAADTTTNPSTVAGLRVYEHLYLSLAQTARRLVRLQGLGDRYFPAATAILNGIMQGFVDQGAIVAFTANVGQNTEQNLRAGIAAFRVDYQPIDQIHRVTIEFGQTPSA